eukprot:CAMPEP_0170532950 /NCGR_PEP_ID=MMETSP0209-20121228/77350_1 /TAXON_ID=665100 ORGANISM="Litonotus pictus, Strain P1" /NCGR_SAMPLE_ID=MMETSP0209 /ASSEMBLY_ACC=CAM_ASM_000301 /LENGTH=104 /DNA_ID=CAMNT_0010829857 /DNA_START=1250 /DNA_END=1560 /DNA_ORIENTATION=-
MTYENKLAMEVINKEINLNIFVMYLKEKISLEPIQEEDLDESIIDDKQNKESKDLVGNCGESTIPGSKDSNYTFNSLGKKKMDMKGDLISNASSTKSCHDMVNG